MVRLAVYFFSVEAGDDLFSDCPKACIEWLFRTDS
jgi:hypothetical protein